MTQVQASSWEIDTKHRDFQQSVRSFVDKHVRPVIEESERAGHPPDVLWKQMGASGLLGLCIPVEHGGSEGDSMADAILAEELTRPSGGHRGITTFLVDSASPGITLGQPLRKMGWHSLGTHEVVIDHAQVLDVYCAAHRGRHRRHAKDVVRMLTLPS